MGKLAKVKGFDSPKKNFQTIQCCLKSNKTPIPISIPKI